MKFNVDFGQRVEAGLILDEELGRAEEMKVKSLTSGEVQLLFYYKMDCLPSVLLFSPSHPSLPNSVGNFRHQETNS